VGVRALIGSTLAVLVLQLGGPFSPAEMRATVGYQADAVADGWWTLVTHLFAYEGVAQAALALAALALFGPRLERRWGTRRFLAFWLWCGFGGVLLHSAVAEQGPPLMGASAAVFGVMFAYAWRWRHEEVVLLRLVPLPARVVIVALALGIVFTTPGLVAEPLVPGPGAGALAPLGGFAFAFLALALPRGDALDRLRQRVSPVPDIPEEQPPRAIPKTPPRQRDRMDEVDEIVARSKAAVAQRPPSPRVVTPPRRRPAERDRSAELDRVLDKISQEGLESLTPEERTVLERYSRRLRGPEEG
jgi:membrane associated rhomboid family serine protease